VLERLIENWLDSAGERTYQPIFCQMLAKQGYTVVHSTRHCPMEYGKDVIAIHPDGTPCAFQLKGNPGGRLTLNQYRTIAPQLQELRNQQIEHPAISKDKPHRSFLVTNGEIEEEVQQAIEQENAANVRDGYANRKLETIARGQLFDWAKSLDTSLWPSELKDTKILFEILTYSGKELFPIEKLDQLLLKLLHLQNDQTSLSEAEFNRRASSAALLNAICLTSFSKQSNHWAIVTAWVLFSVYLVGSAEKSNISEKEIQDLIAFCEDVIFNEIVALLREVLYREMPLVEGNPLPDFAVYSWRYTLLVGIASFAWLWMNKEKSWPDDDFKLKLEKFLAIDQTVLNLWGEAAFPQFLFHIWQQEAIGHKTQSNTALESLCANCLTLPLPTIYYGIEEVLENNLAKTFEVFLPQFSEQETVRHSWVLRQILMHMIQRNMKETCQKIWLNFSSIVSSVFLPEIPWAFCLHKAELGNTMQYVPKTPETWDTLQKESIEAPENHIPQNLLKQPWLLGLWILICPHRAIPTGINHLYKNLI
jgi:hypothetical protein